MSQNELLIYNRKQVIVAEIMLYQGIVSSIDDYCKRFAVKFRQAYMSQNGKVCIADLLK